MYGYSYKSEIVFYIQVSNHDILEQLIIDKFKELYKLVHGREYFEGNKKSMIRNIIDIVFDNDVDYEDDDDESEIDENYENFVIKTIKSVYKYSKIEEIIVYDKTCNRGLIRLKNTNTWLYINENECLLEWIKNNVGRNINYDILRKNIYKKCYVKEKYITSPKFEYSQFILPINVHTYVLFDFKTNESKQVQNDWYIIQSYDVRQLKYINECNLDLAKNILNIYVCQHRIDNLIQMIQSIFIEPKEIIMYDNKQFSSYILSSYVKWICFKLGNIHREVTSIKEVEQISKNIRVLFIYPNNQNEEDEYITNAKKYKINNIVINRNYNISYVEEYKVNNKKLTDMEDIFEKDYIWDIFWYCINFNRV